MSHCRSLDEKYFVNCFVSHHAEYSSWPDFNLAPRLTADGLIYQSTCSCCSKLGTWNVIICGWNLTLFFITPINSISKHVWFTLIFIPVKYIFLSQSYSCYHSDQMHFKIRLSLFITYSNHKHFQTWHTELYTVVLRSILKKVFRNSKVILFCVVIQYPYFEANVSNGILWLIHF